MVDSHDAGAEHDEFEAVHVELDWYDGPRAGLADIDASPHYFRAVLDYAHPDAPDDEYFVWPADAAALAWEREQWAIFVEWNTRYEAGTTTTEAHPGHGGVDARYDELTRLLEPHRTMSEGARRVAAEWRWSVAPMRYHVGGLDYRLRWRPA